MANWSKWYPFPDPRKQGILLAPLGPGVYELRHSETKTLVLRGKGKNCAYRMTSLLPTPYGQGTRKNKDKRNYVFKHIDLIEYRYFPFGTDNEAREFEKILNKENPCLFNT
jgi:hypothetical protein